MLLILFCFIDTTAAFLLFFYNKNAYFTNYASKIFYFLIYLINSLQVFVFIIYINNVSFPTMSSFNNT